MLFLIQLNSRERMAILPPSDTAEPVYLWHLQDWGLPSSQNTVTSLEKVCHVAVAV